MSLNDFREMNDMKIAKAAVADGGGKFSVEEIEVDAPQKDEVRVQMKAAGICHTDYDSAFKWGKKIVMGHEGAGVVESVGPDVTSVQPGDRVMLNWSIPCGSCFQCLSGRPAICEVNSPVTGSLKGHATVESTRWKGEPIERSFHLGTMSEFTLVKEQAVVKIGAAMPFPSACIVGCGVMTGYGSVVNAAKVVPGSSVVVLGCGGVGLNVIQAAKVSGAARIIAVDVASGRFALARQFGATDELLADRADQGLREAAARVKDLTGGRGADYCFECTAIPALGDAPLAFVRNAGVAVQCSGIEQKISFDAELFEWDKTYINPLYGGCRPSVDFPRILGLYNKGDLLLDEMVTTKYRLDQLKVAFDDLLAGKNAKGVIKF